jgi:hypothetical protein
VRGGGIIFRRVAREGNRYGFRNDISNPDYVAGIASVGTVGGRLYLVDLALDESSESSDSRPASLTLLQPAARRDIPGYTFYHYDCQGPDFGLTTPSPQISM